MILLVGVPTEPPLARAIEAAEDAGIGHIVFDQRDHQASDLALSLDPTAGWQGVLRTPKGEVDLAQLRGVYVRLMDERFLPDLVQQDEQAPTYLRAMRFHALLHDWLNLAPIRVASRPRAMLSNGSKTFQALAVRACGLDIPETLVSNDPATVLDFVDRCAAEGDEVIYKSISGTRSIVQTFADADRARIDRVRWCPTQFQRKVRGTDVRVHVVGDQVFGVRIESGATDYRYAARQTGIDAELVACELPDDVSAACVRLAQMLDLPFTGIDLRMNGRERPTCFEANPCPAYSYYESRTGVPIANALVRWLATDTPSRSRYPDERERSPLPRFGVEADLR